jgi:membrane-bound lytic murein transglycosylase D
MLDSLLSMHTYWTVNLAIAIGYLISRSIEKIFGHQTQSQQHQHLRFAKMTFLIIIVIFLAMSAITKSFLLPSDSNFQLQPLLEHASNNFLDQHENVNTQITQIQQDSTLISIVTLCYLSLFLGALFHLSYYVRHVFQLKKLIRTAATQRKIHNITLLFIHETQVPFCWSFLKLHYIVIPTHFLEKKSHDLKLAIRHELQHLRQGDTYWQHFNALLKLVCFWNPFFTTWTKWISCLQEFSCDEAVILHTNHAEMNYAQCLIDTAYKTLIPNSFPHGVLGIMGLSKHFHQSTLSRRVMMLFEYKKANKKKISYLVAYIVCIFATATTAYALNSKPAASRYNQTQLTTLINKIDPKNSLKIAASQEVLKEVNYMRRNDKARSYMHLAIERMNHDKPFLDSELKNTDIPNDILALSIVESGYRPLEENKHRVSAAGIWQIIPSTAKYLGLVVNPVRDDRMDTKLATAAALNYLNEMHKRFEDWKLAVIAYEYGENETNRLIHTIGTRDAWTIARSPIAPKQMKKYLAMFDASVIVMHNPTLVAGS